MLARRYPHELRSWLRAATTRTLPLRSGELLTTPCRDAEGFSRYQRGDISRGHAPEPHAPRPSQGCAGVSGRRASIADVATRGTGTDPAGPVYRLVAGEPARASRPVLDPTQQAVVDHPGGPLLVLAGPGTGKTTTIVEAVARRIEDRVDPEQILVLTFSRKAAAELRTRVTARVARTIREPLARTFHSYAFGVLRRAAMLRGEPSPRLLTAAEQDAVVAELLRGDAEEEGAVRWPAERAPALATAAFRSELRELLLRATERGVGPEQLVAWARELGHEHWAHAAAFQEQYERVTAFATAARGDASGYDPAE